MILKLKPKSQESKVKLKKDARQFVLVPYINGKLNTHHSSLLAPYYY